MTPAVAAKNKRPGSIVSPGESTPEPAATAPSPWHRRWLAYRVLLALMLTTIVLDQVTKAWIVAHLPLGTYGRPDSIPVIKGFLYLVHVGNTGAAWSLFTGKSMLLAVLAIATLGAIFLSRRALGLQARIVQVCFGLLCGGADPV